MSLEIFITTLAVLYEPEYPLWGNIKIVILLAYLRMPRLPNHSLEVCGGGRGLSSSSLPHPEL